MQQNKVFGNYCPPHGPSPCLPQTQCLIPFIVCPKDKDQHCWNMNDFSFKDACDPGCQPPCVPVPYCDFDFLCLDMDLNECPDTERTCTRRDECVLQSKPEPIPAPSPVAEAPRKVAPGSDYHRVNKTGNKLPSSPSRRNETKATRSSSGIVDETKTFEITLVDRKAHPQGARIPEGEKVWAVNGHAGPRLNLKRGTTAFFNIKQEIEQGKTPQTFYFTTDVMGPDPQYPVGESTKLPGTTSAVNGMISLKLDASIPSTFYYQSTAGPFRGGMIVVYDK